MVDSLAGYRLCCRRCNARYLFALLSSAIASAGFQLTASASAVAEEQPIGMYGPRRRRALPSWSPLRTVVGLPCAAKVPSGESADFNRYVSLRRSQSSDSIVIRIRLCYCSSWRFACVPPNLLHRFQCDAQEVCHPTGEFSKRWCAFYLILFYFEPAKFNSAISWRAMALSVSAVFLSLFPTIPRCVTVLPPAPPVPDSSSGSLRSKARSPKLTPQKMSLVCPLPALRAGAHWSSNVAAIANQCSSWGS